MQCGAQVWTIAMLAILASVCARPEQELNSSPQRSMELSEVEIPVLPQDAALRSSRAFSQDASEALNMEGEEPSGTTTEESMGMETERIMTTEAMLNEEATEKDITGLKVKDEESKKTVGVILDRVSRIDHSDPRGLRTPVGLNFLKQDNTFIPHVIQLENSHLGIEERNSNRFKEMNSYDASMSNIHGLEGSGIDSILRISNENEETRGEEITPATQDESTTMGQVQDDDSTKTIKQYPSIANLQIQENPISTNNPEQYSLDNNAMQQLLFNPTLKDIFKYNPAFDYLSKVAHQPNRAASSKVNYDSTSDDNHNAQEPVIRRRIQYHQMVFQPNPSFSQMNPYFLRQQNTFPQPSVISYNPALDYASIINGNRFRDPNVGPTLQTHQQNDFKHQHQQTLQSNVLHYPSMPNKMSSQAIRVNPLKSNIPPQRVYDEYFPVIIHNPFNMMWSAFTNIIEYGPEADVCRAAPKNMRKGRKFVKPSLEEENIDIDRELRFEIPKRFGGPPPFIRRMKVKQGGVAIAGPGGIATAGSGGTAIVGPGGTAYTKEDGSAIVGPGGRLVHVSEFPPLNFFNQPIGEGRTFQDPPGSKLIAMGPVIYYNPRSDS